MTKSKFIIILFIALFLEAMLCSLTPSLFQLCTRDVFAAEEQYYIGNRKCRLCHFEYFKGWEKDPHANAFVRLGRMQNNPYCLKCHTTGYREAQGFVSEKITPELRGSSARPATDQAANTRITPTTRRRFRLEER